MRRAMDETDRRRAIQRAYNEENGITPQSIISQVEMGLAHILKAEYGEIDVEETAGIPEFKTQEELDAYIAKLETEMREAAKKIRVREGGEAAGFDQGAAGEGVSVRVGLELDGRLGAGSRRGRRSLATQTSSSSASQIGGRELLSRT